MQTRKKQNRKLNFSLGAKLVAIALLTLVIIFSLSLVQSQQALVKDLQLDATKALNSAADIMQEKVDGDQESALLLATSIANRPDIQSLTAARDQQSLQNLLTTLFEQLKDQYNVVHFNVIDDRGVIITRLDDPETFGDYVVYNGAVSTTLNSGEATGGFEVDSSGLSMRGVAPVVYDGKFVGMIEVGIDYAENFTNLMQQATRADFVIWFYKPSIETVDFEFSDQGVTAPNEDFTYYAGTKKEGLTTDSLNLNQAFISTEKVWAIYQTGSTMQASLMVPILGPDGTFFGVTEIVLDYTSQLAADQSANLFDQFSFFVISIGGLIAIGAAIAYLVVSPLRRISQFADGITEGSNLSALSMTTGDEFEQVAGALNKMADSIAQKREDLQKQVAQRTAQLQASNEVAKIANSILDPDELIETVVKLISEKLGYYYAAIFTVTDDGRWAELKDATGAAGEALKARRHRLQVGGSSMVGTAISSREARIALDIGEAPVRFNNPLLPNTRSEIALPLLIGDRVLGALDVQSIREADFTTDDISTLQNMVNQVAIALENARLFRQMNESLEELRQTTSEFVSSTWRDRLKAGKLEHTFKPNMAFLNPTDEFKEVQVPLNLRDQQIGQIMLEISQDWEIEDQAWVESLATQVAISLENSRLLEESQQSAMRERLSASIIQKVWSANSVDTILQTTVRELARSLEASEVKIELKAD
jgi:GAF domain-containing protein/HAMP domain-containing protein